MTTSSSPSAPAPQRPYIRLLPDDAETLTKLMGYSDAVVYEFAGTWLECWLECDVDGELVESSSHARVALDSLSESEQAETSEAEQEGWISIWGSAHHHLSLKMRTRCPNDQGGYFFPLSMTLELAIPDRADGVRYSTGTSLSADSSEPIKLPPPGEEFVLQSYSWEERSKPDGPVVRTVEVRLKAKRVAS